MGEQYLNRPRQELPCVYIRTGAIYIAGCEWFLGSKSFYSALTSGYLVPEDRSLDIDFMMFETILRTKSNYRN